MACWCDGPTMVDKECPCGARWRAPEHWQHCPYCGRDLRLPVARVWRHEEPPAFKGEQYWCLAIEAQWSTPTRLPWESVRHLATVGGGVFGPVTVSPLLDALEDRQ